MVNILSSTASSTSDAVGGFEIDLAERMWTIPKKRMKMRRDHKVPLSGAAVALLQATKGALVFKGTNDVSALLIQIKDRGSGGLERRGRAMPRVMAVTKITALIDA